MKLYLPHAFSIPGKDGELVEYKAGSIAAFDGVLAKTLVERFGAEPVATDDAPAPTSRIATAKTSREKDGGAT